MLKEDTDQFVIKKLYIFVHVCLCPINVKTSERIGTKFCVRLEPLMTTRKVCG